MLPRIAPVIFLALFGLTLISACGAAPPLQQIACLPGGEAVAILEDLAAGVGPSKLKSNTPKPQRSTLDYTVAGRPHQGDLYVTGTPDAAIVLVPGASTAGKDDERLVAFAESLARSRFAVLVPDMPNVRQFKVTPDDGRVIADAFSFLSSRPDLAPQGRAGMGAFSYALGPTILAAMEPDIRENVRFVMGVGGYYNLPAVVTYFTTGFYREGKGPWQYLKPSNYGKWYFVLSNVDRFSDPRDKATLAEMGTRMITTPGASVDDLAGRLVSAEGLALYALLANTDPDKVPDLMSRLPMSVRTDIDALDLAKRDLSMLKTRLLLVHGYEDDLVPYTESLALATAAPARARAFLVGGLVHVDLKPPGFFDAWRMGCAVGALLDERWRGP